MMGRVTRRTGVVVALALGLLVAACGGGASGASGASGAGGTSSSGGGGGSSATKAAGGGHAAQTGENTVSFTASGGLSGPITLKANLNDGSGNLISYHLAAQQKFYVDLTDQSGKDRQQFILDFTGYAGPGTYSVNPKQAGAAADEAVHFELIVPGSDLGNNLWLIDKTAAGSCTVVVTSVTPVGTPANAPMAPPSHPTSGFSEVQGTIACPSVPVYIADGTPPLTVSDGHFDLLMAEQQ
jgi:hypothetical protein